MNNKLIFLCDNCGEHYCGECSTNKDWEHFCSTSCEEEYAEDNKDNENG